MSFGLSSRLDQYANSGWGVPPSRTRRERITSTLLGKDNGKIRCPLIIQLGFDLQPGEDALERIHDLLVDEGYSGTDDLRSAMTIPNRPYICKPSTHRGCRLTADPKLVLQQALMLGLCTALLFDPTRPVIWTRSSLTRVVDLFDPEGFYQ